LNLIIPDNSRQHAGRPNRAAGVPAVLTMETTEIILRENGTLAERIITERELEAGPAVLDALTEGVTRELRHVLTLPDWGPVHASVGLTDTVWTVAINRIPLHTRFQLIDQVLVPVFTPAPDLELPLVWQAPAAVRLAFVIRMEEETAGVRITGNWLFACDAERRGYRLPLPNLHDDCLLCTGQFRDEYPSASEAVSASLEQFRKSKWNADLLQGLERSQQFFRFQPTNETFTTLPIAAADWTTLCTKVATDILERVVL
jgi:hypothetical protein